MSPARLDRQAAVLGSWAADGSARLCLNLGPQASQPLAWNSPERVSAAADLERMIARPPPPGPPPRPLTFPGSRRRSAR